MEPMSFKIDQFIETIMMLAGNPERMNASAAEAETARSDYSVETIANQWEALFGLDKAD